MLPKNSKNVTATKPEITKPEATVSYRALGTVFYSGGFARPGDVITGLTPFDVKYLLEQNAIELIAE